jgi:hypothetical protein
MNATALAKPRLTLEELESREVPAALQPTVDLTKLGATGSINGVIFQQYNAKAPANAANGNVQSFLRLDDGGSERGYNTDARPLQFDESRNAKVTHSIKVSDLPLVTIGGVQYRELVLDVNEPTGRNSKISLDELQFFVSNDPKLHNYNAGKDTLGGVKAVWDMGNRWVSMDAALNNRVGTGDILVDIPASLLTGGTYFALYSKFGTHQKADGAYEQWGPGFKTAAQPATITGIAFFDQTFDGIFNQGDTLAVNQAVSLYINGVLVQTVNTDSNGRFTFTVSNLTGAVSYTIQTNDFTTITPLTGSIDAGVTINQDLALMLAE